MRSLEPSARWTGGNDPPQGDGRDTYVALGTSSTEGMRDGPPRREAQGHGVPVVVVGVTSHQGAEESSAQGEGVQVSAAERQVGVRDAQGRCCFEANRLCGGQALESRVPGNGPALFGEGPTEKGRQRYLAGGLLYSCKRGAPLK